MKISTLSFYILTLLMTLTRTAEARNYLSARRPNRVSFSEVSRSLGLAISLKVENGEIPEQKDPQDAYSSRENYKEFSHTERLVKWPQDISFEQAFKKVRDSRVIKKDPNFPRRPTWLYPDDGCFARAEILSRELQDAGYPAPSKIFAFGDLKLKTPFAPHGFITWWYHVVIGYKVHNETMVMDPAVDANRPLTLKEWIKAMGGDADISVCQSTAIDPDSKCLTESKLSPNEALELDSPFLKEEWNRVVDLGRDPEKDLGDNPPWLKGQLRAH